MKKSLQSIYFVAAIVIIGILLFIWLPEVGNIVTETPTTAMPKDEFSENAELVPQNEDSAYDVVAVDKENVKALIKSYIIPDKLTWSVTYSLNYGSGVKSQYITYTKNKNNEKVEVYSSSKTLITSYALNKNNVTIKDVKRNRSVTVSRTYQYDPLSLLHMPKMDFFYEADDKNIKEARFETLDDKRVLYVEYNYPYLNQTEKYWISLDFGVPIIAESYLDGKLYMTTTTTSISAD